MNQDRAERHILPWKKRLRQAPAAVLGAVGLAVLSASPHSQPILPRPPVVAASPRPFQNPDMNVLVVETPGTSPVVSDEGIRRAIEDTSKRVEFATDGAVSLDRNITVDHVTATPDGVRATNKNQTCFTGEQTRQLHNTYRASRNLGKTSILSIVYNSVADCSLYRQSGGAAAYATTSKGQPYIVMNSPLFLGALTHEMGHVWGLPHAKRVDVNGANGRYGLLDTVELTQPKYELTKVGTWGAKKPLTSEEISRRQEYSSPVSVMGETNMNVHVSLFTAEELAKIAPDRFRIRDVPSTPGDYEVTMLEDGYAGIRMPLSADHPLKKIDPGITALTFGLSVLKSDKTSQAVVTEVEDPAARLQLVVSARGKFGTYTLDASGTNYPLLASAISPKPELDSYRQDLSLRQLLQVPFDRKTVFVDKERDIVVTAYRNQQGKTMVNIGTAASTAEYRAALERLYQQRYQQSD